MPSHFSRPTLIAAANQLTFLDHAEFDNLMLSFSIDQHITYGPGLSKQNKANELIRYARTRNMRRKMAPTCGTTWLRMLPHWRSRIATSGLCAP